MATGKMSFNYYQNGKYGSLPQNPQKDMEVTQDMHLKMSKKIAQLTKVIYALNTKNDENEAVLQTVKDQHEEEKQQLLAELQSKIQQFKSRLDGESDHQQQISILQSRISEYEQQHNLVEDRFLRLKEEAAAKERQQQEEYSHQMQQLTQDVLRAKREFEEQLQAFEAWKLQADKSHTAALQTLVARHQLEVEELGTFHHSQDSDWLTRCAQIEERYKDDMQKLEEQLAASHAQRYQIEEDFTQKLAKAKAFYEQELQALQKNQSSSHEETLARLRQQQEKLRQDFGAQEGELRKQIDRLVRQLAQTEDTAEAQKQELEQLRLELGGKSSIAQSVSQKLQVTLDELAAAQLKLREVETELAASKERCSDQAQDLIKKSGLIGQLEATKLQKTAQVEELTKKLEHLQMQLARLNADRSSLQSQQQTMSSEVQQQITSLQRTIEDLTIEGETLRQRHEREVASLTQLMEERVSEVTNMLGGKLAAEEKQHAEDRDRDRKTAAEVLVQTRQELQAQFSDERAKMQAEIVAIQNEFERVKAELLFRCKQAEDEVARLSKLVKESEEGLGSASGHINSLKEAAAALKSELDKTRADLKATKISNASLQAEAGRLQLLHTSKSSEWQQELKQQLEKQAAQLDSKWTETMRAECNKLRQEVIAQKDDEMRAALEHFSKLKGEAFAAERAGFETRLAQLNRQLSDLRQKLDLAHSSSAKEQNKLRAELEEKRARLLTEMNLAAEDYAHKIKQMEEMHSTALQKTIIAKEAEKTAREEELRKIHYEDMKAQMSAHRLALQASEEMTEQQHKVQMREAEDKFYLKQEAQKLEMLQRLELELGDQRKTHSMEIHAARMELERAVEISKQKERDHQLRAEELQEEIGQRETHIIKLKEEVKRLQTSINSLNRAVVDKDKETEFVRAELREQFRQMEDRLKRENKANLNNLTADYSRESQEMVFQFNTAQGILKDKISEMQITLAEAEDKYNHRDSRPEDLELIHQQREEISEREMRIKQLIDEKRFYQLELVNRETNFNKVFNTTPNVGVLNPLSVSTRPKLKGEKPSPPVKRMSAPSIGGAGSSQNSLSGSTHSVNSHSQRLVPLPNSPIHDSSLNPTKPLPQPGGFSKKFVK